MQITEAALESYTDLLDFIHTAQPLTAPQLAKEYVVRCEDGRETHNYVLTPIEIIARMGLLDHLKVLLYPSNPPTSSISSICSVLSCFVAPKTRERSHPYTKFEQALFKAIDGGHLNLVQYLLALPHVIVSLDQLNTGDYINKKLYLLVASVSADVPSMEILTTLLSIPCIAQAVAKDNNQVLMTAMKKGLSAQIEHLLALPLVSSSLASGKNKVLRAALCYNQIDLVNQLLDNPAVMSIIAVKQNRVLKIAAFYGHLTCVDRLLENPAVYDAADSEGNAALQLAAVSGHMDIVKRLLQIPHVADKIACAKNIVFRHVVYNLVSDSEDEPILDKASQQAMIKLLLTYESVVEGARNEIRTSRSSYSQWLLLQKSPPTRTRPRAPKKPISIPSDEQIEQFLSGHALEETVVDAMYQLIAYHSYRETIDMTRCEFDTDTNGLSYPVGGFSGECLPYWGFDNEIRNGIEYDDDDCSVHLVWA